jgi:hypothetical protein
VTPLALLDFEGNAAAACLPLLTALARAGEAMVHLPLGERTLQVRKRG